MAGTCIVMSQKVYENLPPEGKKAIDEVGSAYPAKVIPMVKKTEEEFATKLKADGVQFIDVDKKPFVEAAQGTPDHFKDWTPGLYKEAQKAIAD